MNRKSQAEKDETNRNMRNAMKMAEQSDQEIVLEHIQGTSLYITTKLVAILSFSSMLSFVITLILLTYYYQVERVFNIFTFSAVLLTVILFIAKNNIKEFYILDEKKQAIMVKRQVFSETTTRMKAHFRTIEASVANGRYCIGRRHAPSHWKYRAEIILKSGNILPVSDWYREDFVEADARAKTIADISKCDFVQSKVHSTAKPMISNGKHTFVLKGRTKADKLREIMYLILEALIC